MNAPDRHSLRMSRFIRAPREKVFDAFLDAEALRQWHHPRAMTVAEASAQAEVGGRYRVVLQARDGSQMAVGGTYREIRRPERLVYTWQWEGGGPMSGTSSLVEIDFIEKDGGTELQMHHSGFANEAERDGHGRGWNASFNHLTELLDPRGTAATVTLLGDPRSTYTRTARMGLAEKGVAYTLKPCAPHTPEILAVHPFGRIPAMLDGDLKLHETSAILRYVDESFEGPALLPDAIHGRAQCEQWVSAVNCYLYDTMVRRYVLQYIFPKGEGGQPDRAVIGRALQEMPAQLAVLERAYGKSDYLAGPKPSLADLFVAPILAYVEQFPEGRQLLRDLPNIRRGQLLLRQRASFTGTDPARG